MEIILIGLSHHSAPLEIRERLWFPGDALPGSLRRLRDIPALAESVLLSTCNRTEIVAVVPERKAGFTALLEFLDAEKGFPTADAARKAIHLVQAR